jgi:hypothetical protein
MVDSVIQIEVVLNLLNGLLAKSVAFRDSQKVKELEALRHKIYYEKNFNYGQFIKNLEEISAYLKKYDIP